jgi:hypothetical protein
MVGDELRPAVEAADAIAATFAARLDALVASWELAIRNQRVPGPGAQEAVPRAPTAVLADLERELLQLESHCAEHRHVAEDASRQADDWQQRAMRSIEEGRDDLAGQALMRSNELAAAGRVAAEEAEALEQVRDAFENAVKAVRTTVGTKVE